MKKKILLIDMDGVIVDLKKHIDNFFEKYPYLFSKYEHCPDHIPGIFRNPTPYFGAVDAINKLNESGKYDMFIATSSPWGNPEAATDKRYWIETYFGNLFHKKLIITHRKDMIKGDILIDDRDKNGASEFDGEFIRFGYNHITNSMNEYKDWSEVLKYLL